MFTIRSVLALFFVALVSIAFVSAAPNRVLMRFGKRSDPFTSLGDASVDEPIQLVDYYRFVVPQNGY